MFDDLTLNNGTFASHYYFNLKAFPVTKKPSSSKKPEVTNLGYDARQAPINIKLGQDEKVALYRDMVRIRRFEERCLRSYQQGKIGGFLHLILGKNRSRSAAPQ